MLSVNTTAIAEPASAAHLTRSEVNLLRPSSSSWAEMDASSRASASATSAPVWKR
jgi:hypothetical protein